ncbi:ATP-binding protein [Thalassococcus sp. BH17M4-6]|uniref:hybrid sensor histidine kinase/response regulator n=1 Tax=Thalassococcus sp. BH17M4-6 TaxID=3413148 RepID=UPI003BCD3A5D
MTDAILEPARTARTSRALAQRAGVILTLAVCCLGAASLAPQPALRLGLAAAGGAFLMAALLAGAVQVWAGWSRARALRILSDFVERDAAACVITDPEGEVTYLNATARDRFAASGGRTLAALLRPMLADPAGLLFRLETKARNDGVATEDVPLRGGSMRLTGRVIHLNNMIWRVEYYDENTIRTTGGPGQVPHLTLGRNGTILSMNDAMRDLTGRRAKRLDEVLTDLPLRPGEVNTVLTDAGPMPFLASIIGSGPGREELVLLPVPDEDTVPRADTDFETLPVPLLKVAPDGTVQRANRETRMLLDVDDTAGYRLGDFMEGLGRSIQDWLADAAAGRGLGRSEFLRLTRGEREMFVQVTLNRVVEDGAPVLVAVLNDATELKTLEAQFVQSQKMQAIGQLAGGVAHDFNNLLTAISGHCDLMLLRHDQGDPDYGDLVQIHQNANRAAALVGQLLAFSRKQTLRPEVMDLRDTLSDLTHLLNRLVGEKVALTLRHDPVLPAIRGDKRQLEQVMMNLVVNARDAMPDGGSIEIETGQLVLREPLKRDRATVAPGSYVSVKVTDEGTGIPTDKLQKIFEPFFTTKPTGEGTGLGLSTVYGIVKQTGGFIFVDSVPGQGSCFTLLLPSHDATLAPPKAPQPQLPRKMPIQGEGVVLLVEDEAPVRAFASRALRLRGFTVIEAGSAEEALALLEDEGLSVDVFVTDVVMPGLDGPTWVRQALKDRPEVRVVFVSGYAEDLFDDDQQRIANSIFLPKPFSLNDLTEVVYQQIA